MNSYVSLRKALEATFTDLTFPLRGNDSIAYYYYYTGLLTCLKRA